MVFSAFIAYATRPAALGAAIVADLRFPVWLRLVPAFGGLAAVGLAALFWLRGRRWLAVRLGLFGAFVALMVTPTMWGDGIVVSNTGIEQPHGMLGRRARGFRFADVDSIRIATERDKYGDPQEVWYAHGHDGRVGSFVAGDLWRFHRDSILTLLRANHVDIRSRVVATR